MLEVFISAISQTKTMRDILTGKGEVKQLFEIGRYSYILKTQKSVDKPFQDRKKKEFSKVAWYINQ